MNGSALMQALTERRGHHAPMAEILRTLGLASETQIADALAQQLGTHRLTASDGPPDPRLIDRLGGARCLSIGCLPWRSAGAVTLIATCRPETFAEHRGELESVFGPVVMVIITEDALNDAILGCRINTLRLGAESSLPDPLSCRSWDRARFNRGVLAGAALLAAFILLAPMATLSVLFALVMIALVAGTLLKLAAMLVGLRRARRPALMPVRGQELPVISIMVPMYREPEIAPRLIQRLGALTYPRAALDVLLVVEADDMETREALHKARLPPWIRVIPVPHSPLRTKPRALNYALSFARGSIIGVYDAEDMPDPDQLTRVAQRFAIAPPDTACLQGALDYFNPRTNWLSRCFTIEYAVWFRLVLPGLDRLGLVVPLGGTTLFFRRAALERLGGWDAHNVTEDADLGIRLARHGYRTELIDTVTREEANCHVIPWIKQRSRWLKGYAMTYAVHMRAPRVLWRELGPVRFIGVQVLFLGTLIQFFLAPLLWSFWLILFGLDHPALTHLPAPLFWGVIGCFMASELVGFVAAWIALGRARHGGLRLWAPSLALYFPLAAFAAYKAGWEMLSSPFYWDKTTHGLHDHAA